MYSKDTSIFLRAKVAEVFFKREFRENNICTCIYLKFIWIYWKNVNDSARMHITEDVAAMGIRFRLYGCERMRRERMIGENIISFAQLNLDQETTHLLHLEPRSNLGVSFTCLLFKCSVWPISCTQQFDLLFIFLKIGRL